MVKTYLFNIWNLPDYYRKWAETSPLGWDSVKGLSDSGYPRFLARGVCFRSAEVIIALKLGNWQRTLMHEIGHMCGYEHTNEHGHIMHPWGLFRGDEGIDECMLETYTTMDVIEQ